MTYPEPAVGELHDLDGRTMATPPSSWALQDVANFRDVGRTVNAYLGERRIREGVFFRSARLDDATAEDRHTIAEDAGIKTVIDLRTKSEHLKQAKKHQGKLAAAAGHDRPDDAVVQPPRIGGLDYHEIKITGRAFEIYLLRQLSWWSLIKFLILFTFGYRMQALGILGREVMLPRGLVGLGLATMDLSGAEIRETLLLYTSASPLPSVVHCTHGKDRTGLICALVLMILDIPIDAVEHDYFLTDIALSHGLDQTLAELREVGLPDDWAGTASNMITAIRDHLDERYGGLDGYLDHIGFTKADRCQVRDTLLY